MPGAKKTIHPNRDLELIYELGAIRFIPRVWKQMLGPNFANLAEHTFRLAWTSLLLSKLEGQGDSGKIVKMALVHDIAESRTGDAHYISRLYTKRNEHKAIRDVFKNTSLQKEMVVLWAEYEKRKSMEAKIVKDADTLDVDLELHEQAANGNTLEKHWHKLRARDNYPKLYTNSAKQLWKQIKTSNVHDWHLHAPNRHSKGDWK